MRPHATKLCLVVVDFGVSAGMNDPSLGGKQQGFGTLGYMQPFPSSKTMDAFNPPQSPDTFSIGLLELYLQVSPSLHKRIDELLLLLGLL